MVRSGGRLFQQNRALILVVDDDLDGTVVIDVAERRAAPGVQLLESRAGAAGNIVERSVAVVAVENHRIPVSHGGIQPIHLGENMTGHEKQVFPAVIIEIEKAAAPPDVARVARQSSRRGDIVKLAVAAIMVESLALIGKIRAENVEPAVAVIVGGRDAHAGHRLAVLVIGDAAKQGLFRERPLALVDTVESGVAGMPTAFVATYGHGKPVIGIIGEFDALPGLSQEDVPERKARVEGGPGHGCGHNLFGAGSALAAIALKDWLVGQNISGTIRFYGTPAQEGGRGEVYNVRVGVFQHNY